MLTTKPGAPAATPELQALAADGGAGTAPYSRNAVKSAVADQGNALQRRPAAARRISIFGLGYVGAVSLACLARDGHRVIGVDIDPVKLDLIRSRRSPILEEGIQELMRDVVESGRVTVTDDAAQALQDTEVSFV